MGGLKGGSGFPAGACRRRVRPILIRFRRGAITQTFPAGLSARREAQINLSFIANLAGKYGRWREIKGTLEKWPSWKVGRVPNQIL